MLICPKIISETKALVIEDGKTYQHAAKIVIEEHGIKKLYQAFTPDEAISILVEHNFNFDFILVDYLFAYGNVTNKNGTDIIKFIRKHDPQVKILAFSFDTNRNEELLKAGASSIIGKTKYLKELKFWLEEHLPNK